MKINIVGRKVNLRVVNFTALVEHKLSKFDRIFDEDAEATVIVTAERNRQTVEITIRQRGMVYRAEETAPDMNDALDKVISALGNQIRRNKTKLERARKLSPSEEPEFYEPPEEDESEPLIRTKRFAVQVMTPEEAILQMDMLGHEFFLFRSDEGGEINVVYKRHDGGYGLLVPEDE